MDETRAVARLPHLDIEIRHRRLPEEQAEQLTVSLKATPSFEAFAEFLARQAPWRLFAQMAQASWQPWLAASSALLAAPSRPTSADDRERGP